MILDKRMNKRLQVVPKSKKVQRPCNECRWFRWLDANHHYGVCDKHEKPSDPRDCVVYRRRLDRI